MHVLLRVLTGSALLTRFGIVLKACFHGASVQTHATRFRRNFASLLSRVRQTSLIYFGLNFIADRQYLYGFYSNSIRQTDTRAERLAMFLWNVECHRRQCVRCNRVSMRDARRVVSPDAFKQIRRRSYVLCDGPSAFQRNLLHIFFHRFKILRCTIYEP